MDSEYVGDVCEKLVANDPKLTRVDVDAFEVYGDVISDEGWCAIAEAMEKNTTIEEVHIDFCDGVLSLSTALSLASAFLAHPKLRKLHFSYVVFADSFGPIALAICQNERLNRLEIDHSSVTSNLMESMRHLVKKNALGTLGIQNCYGKGGQLVDFAGTLANNKSLKNLSILNDDAEDVFASNVLEEIARMLKVNANFQSLNVELQDNEYSSDIISRVAEAVEGHESLAILTLNNLLDIDEDAAQALGNMLANSALRELNLTGCRIGDEGVLHLSSGLESQNCKLQKLNLRRNNKIGCDGASALAAALRGSNTIEELNLSFNSIGDRGAFMLAELVTESKNIVHLNLCLNNIGPGGATAIAHALLVNKSLKALDLGLNPIGDDGAIRIANALTVNTTLESIYVGEFGATGLNGFIASLPHMQALKSLRFSLRSSDCFNEANSGAFLRALEQNKTLEHFHYYGMYDDSQYRKIMKQVKRIVALNRAGRRILGSPAADIPSLWPHVLAKSSDNADAIYFFLHQNPQLFMKQSILGKRKREHWSCTIM